MAIIYGKPEGVKQIHVKYPHEYEQIRNLNRQIRQKTGLFGFIAKWRTKRQIGNIKKSIQWPVRAGAHGEHQVVKKLAGLCDEYRVLCDVRIELPDWVLYRGSKNLKSAQMDFVVVCRKGIFVLEVKNWSKYFIKNYDGFSPHEQADRAGRVLWHILHNSISDIRVNSILLSVQNNIGFDCKYRWVFVTSLEQINSFLEKRQDCLSDLQVAQVVYDLQPYIQK